ncbi:FadR/GntR family transcriptional regulator [Bifidobacterium sp.]|jgi:DNA-binding FadR family transcriptional regulator|uniref:FadR/GntR family transcriptional regulator n=1 Tax=Bifidobacterium sp. TaxID=41200 RepID=UPI0025B8EB7C|nr:FadR/GntR family transcriptional regulator [Bifidobacterium sp.]MCH4209738.1 FadR family transcriptional regulator [Bifidobacterium sp.]MCI1224900.1 FadR family transcriptional regulator [Bifidobacterium sp.]
MTLSGAFDAIRGFIADGVFKPGDKLPSEEQLCEMLGMSRSPVREALQMLGALNVVDIRQGSGIYVKKLSAEELIASLSLTIGLMPLPSLLDMYDLRLIVEASLAERAAALITGEQIDELSRLQHEIEGAIHPDDTAELDNAFHGLIAQAANSPASRALIDVMRSRSSNYRLFRTNRGIEVFRTSNAGHRELINAFRRHDPMLAKGAMSAHIDATRGWLAVLKPESQPERQAD